MKASRTPLEAYFAEVSRLMRERYSITWDDAGGGPEPVETAFRDGESAESFVEWWAQKYGLTPRKRAW